MVTCSLVPGPLPDFISQLWIPIFLQGCEIKSGSGLGTRLGEVVVHTTKSYAGAQERGSIFACIVPGFNHSHYIANLNNIV